MTKRRQGFIVVVAALMALYASAALAAKPEKCKKEAFPATGQTTSYRVQGDDDGGIEAGATLSYTDNGDGTITDNNTCLMWEKKSDDGSIHDKENVYTWSNAFDVHVATLNAMNFAGFNDWRVPNVKELQSIVNHETQNPSVSTEFNNNCTPGTTVLTGSCTSNLFHWSSSTVPVTTSQAWDVSFYAGDVSAIDKGAAIPVRAVRGGSNLGSSQ